MEAVHVELPDKRGHVGVLVVVGQQGAGELALIPDPERGPVLCPANVVIWKSCLNIFFEKV